MSISTLISGIQSSKQTIRAKLVELGLAQSTDDLATLATKVDSIQNKGAVSATVQEGDTYTIPKGYHNGSGTVSGVAGGGNYSLQSRTVTPTTSEQNVTPDSGYYGLSDVTVAPIPESYRDVSGVTATAPDILAGKVIIGSDGATLTGTMVNNGTVTKTINGLTATSVSLAAGYYAGGSVSLTDDIEQALAAI